MNCLYRLNSMVSYQTNLESKNLSKKRKWEEPLLGIAEGTKSSTLDIEPSFETPLPLEWQRCLDIESGQIYFYNTRTKKRALNDPRRISQPLLPTHDHMSLDLELNLPCHSPRRDQDDPNALKSQSTKKTLAFDLHATSPAEKGKNIGGLERSPSWLAGEKEDRQEMVAAVCTRCHMLVVMCKSSPTCPNCKFMHPPDQTPPFLHRRNCSLLC